MNLADYLDAAHALDLAAGYDPGSLFVPTTSTSTKGKRTATVMTPQRAAAALITPRRIAPPPTDTSAKAF